jgi:hypothetical protein
MKFLVLGVRSEVLTATNLKKTVFRELHCIVLSRFQRRLLPPSAGWWVTLMMEAVRSPPWHRPVGYTVQHPSRQPCPLFSFFSPHSLHSFLLFSSSTTVSSSVISYIFHHLLHPFTLFRSLYLILSFLFLFIFPFSSLVVPLFTPTSFLISVFLLFFYFILIRLLCPLHIFDLSPCAGNFNVSISFPFL